MPLGAGVCAGDGSSLTCGKQTIMAMAMASMLIAIVAGQQLEEELSCTKTEAATDATTAAALST